VDVYDAEGRLIVNGLMPRISWYAARGDHVYGLETTEEGEQQLVRYRLDLGERPEAGA